MFQHGGISEKVQQGQNSGDIGPQTVPDSMTNDLNIDLASLNLQESRDDREVNRSIGCNEMPIWHVEHPQSQGTPLCGSPAADADAKGSRVNTLEDVAVVKSNHSKEHKNAVFVHWHGPSLVPAPIDLPAEEQSSWNVPEGVGHEGEQSGGLSQGCGSTNASEHFSNVGQLHSESTRVQNDGLNVKVCFGGGGDKSFAVKADQGHERQEICVSDDTAIHCPDPSVAPEEYCKKGGDLTRRGSSCEWDNSSRWYGNAGCQDDGNIDQNDDLKLDCLREQRQQHPDQLSGCNSASAKCITSTSRVASSDRFAVADLAWITSDLE